jgi:hypothetical protein
MEPTPEEVRSFARNAGLDLPEAYFAQLVGAYANVRRMIASLPGNRARADEPAHSFVAVRFKPEGK